MCFIIVPLVLLSQLFYDLPNVPPFRYSAIHTEAAIVHCRRGLVLPFLQLLSHLFQNYILPNKNVSFVLNNVFCGVICEYWLDIHQSRLGGLTDEI